MDNKERGAIVIEASLALPVFMFVIVTLLSIVNICYTQAKMGVALNLTAKEISQYTYLYGLTGLSEKHEGLYSSTSEQRNIIDETISGVGTLYSSASSLTTDAKNVIDNPDTIVDKYESMGASIEQGKASIATLKTQMEKIGEDPKDFMLGCAKILGNEVANDSLTVIGGELARVLMKKHLVESSSDDCESFLKRMKVVPKDGSYIGGLDFYVTEFLWNGTNEIKIRVKYDVKVLDFFGHDVKFTFEQCGSTLAWFESGQGPASLGSTGETTAAETTTTGATETTTGADGEEPATVPETTTVETTTVPETTTEEETTDLDYDNIITMCSMNALSDQVMITSATDAATYEMAYLDITRYPGYFMMTDEQIIKLKEKYLERQSRLGRTFYFTPEMLNGFNAGYIDVGWLIDQGYSIEFNEGISLYVMKKND